MTTAIQPAREMRAELQRFTPRMIEVVGARGADEYVSRQITLAMLKIKDSQALQKCAPESIAAAMIRLCGDRLEVGVTAHLVPMKGQCVYVRDWKGDAELMIRSGHVRDVKAFAVHERDAFRVGVRDGVEYLDFEPALVADRGEVVAVFALARLRHGYTTHEVMTRAEVDAIRARVSDPKSTAWEGHFVEMAKKTVMHRIAKRLPKGQGGLPAMAPDGAEDLPAGQMEGAPALARGNDGYAKMLGTPAEDAYGVVQAAAEAGEESAG